MPTGKEIMKGIILAMVGSLITIVLTSIFAWPKTVNAKIDLVEQTTNEKIATAKKESFDYTDKAITTHEEKQIEQLNILHTSISSLKEASQETKSMVKYLYEHELNKQTK